MRNGGKVHYNELVECLQNLINRKVSQKELSEILGITAPTTMSGRATRNSRFTTDEIRKIENHFKVNILSENTSLRNMSNEDEIQADYYEDVFGSCGSGAFVFSENKKPIMIPRECFKSYSPFRIYSVINAIGDSMLPYIHEKDRLIVEHWNGEQIRDNGVYVFRLGDNIFVKRLVLNIDQLVIKSDNELYPIRFVEIKDLSDFQIIGQIVGLMRNMK